MSVSPKTVLITGCSTGVGLATAILLAKHDEKKFKVYATIREIGACKTLEKEAGESLNSTLFIKQLDVTSKEQIDSVIDKILAAGERIDILGNSWLCLGPGAPRQRVSPSADIFPEIVSLFFTKNQRSKKQTFDYNDL